MAHTQKDLLANAQRVDAGEFARGIKITKAMHAAARESTPPAAFHPVHLLQLEDQDDPFKGNLNNRRVAARIAAKREVTSGDPVKAAADVKKSLAILPDAVVPTGDDLPPIVLAAPTPGSPAANKNNVRQMVAQADAVPSAAQAAVTPTGTDTPAAAAPPQWGE